MMHTKKYMLFFVLIGACHMQGAAYAGRALKAASAVGAVATLGGVIAYKMETDRLLADPDAKFAFEMLNSPENCTLDFTIPSSFGGMRISGLTAKSIYALIDSCENKAWEDLRVRSHSASCVLPKYLEQQQELASFLKRIDFVEAPVLGIEAPGLRRLINWLTNHQPYAGPEGWALEKLKSSPEDCRLHMLVIEWIGYYEDSEQSEQQVMQHFELPIAVQETDVRALYSRIKRGCLLERYPSSRNQEIRDLKFCVSQSCTALCKIKSSKDLEQFLEAAGMR